MYASTCEPLALLEKLVHFAGLRRLTYSLYIADVPDNLMEDLPATSLPPDWRSIYPPPSTQQLGRGLSGSNLNIQFFDHFLDLLPKHPINLPTTRSAFSERSQEIGNTHLHIVPF